MNWNLFWSMYIFAFAIVSWIAFYMFGLKKLKKDERCCEHSVGTVIGASNIRCGGFSLPRVKYVVNGKSYKVAGPKFRSSIVTSVSTPFESVETKIETNLTTKENIPLKLKVKIRKNSLSSVMKSPLFELFPIGAEVDVYYNPVKPKESYVQRYEGVAIWLVILLGAIAIILTVFGLCILFGPEIIMN